MNQHTKPAPRNRILAGVLLLIYVALLGLAFYLDSTGATKHWPPWALWVAGATWGAIMLALPFLVAKYFFGISLMPRRPWQFSLRTIVIYVLCIIIFILVATMVHWRGQ